MLDEPSPNDQSHDVGVLDEVSLNRTVKGTIPDVMSAVNDATGELTEVTVIYPVIFVVLLPAEFFAVRETEYVPVSVYSCAGFWSVDFPPSPNCQLHVVGEFSDVSVNRTVRGAVPLVISEVKLATGVA